MNRGVLVNCYKEFAQIYDELINADINYELWSRKILSVIEELEINKKDYLDLACGTANMSVQLAPYFQSLWALDISEEMLTEAEYKFRKAGIKAKLVNQSIDELSLNRKFDLITCCLDSTNYLLEDGQLERYFKGVYGHLQNKGLFVFDINSYYKLTQVLGNNLYTYDDENVTYIWENILTENIVDMYLTFFVKQGQDYKKFNEQHTERAYTCEHIENLVKKLGFKIYKKLDNYENVKVTECSERITYFLVKSEA